MHSSSNAKLAAAEKSNPLALSRNILYNNLFHVHELIFMLQFDRKGYIDMMELHNVVRSFNIPAKQELLDAVLMRMQRNSQGQIDYKQYIDAINWRDHPGTLRQ